MRTTQIKNNFNTGEISPFLVGRTDLAKYTGACELLENFYCRVQGGVSRRPGLRYITSFEGNLPHRLIPWSSGADNSFILLFYDGFMTVYSVKTETMVASTTYLFNSVDDMELIKYVRIGDIMYLVHPKYPIHKISKVSDTNWIITLPEFRSPPATQQDEDVSGGVLSIGLGPLIPVPAATGLLTAPFNYVTFSPGPPPNFTGGLGSRQRYPFIASMIGKIVTAGTGSGIITGIQGGGIQYPTEVKTFSQAIITITNPFPESFYGAGTWSIDSIVQPYSALTIAGGTPTMAVGDQSITSASPVFIKGDINKQIVAGSGIGIINQVTGTTAVDPITGATLYNIANITTLNQFDDVSYNPGFWFLRGSPEAYFSAGTYGVISANAWQGSNMFGVGSIVTIRSTPTHLVDFSFQQSTGTSYVHIKYDGTIVGFPTFVFTEAFRSSDIGRFVSFSGGYGQVVEVISSTEIRVQILSPPSQSEPDAQGNLIIAPSFPGSWVFDDLAFTINNGFPNSICFFQDRLWFAGTLNNPQTIWGSKTDDFENFAKGALDDAGIEVTVASGDIDEILWLQPYLGTIVLGTFRGEHVLSGSGISTVGQNTQAITPSNVSITFQSAYGVTPIQPAIIQDVLFYIQRSQFNIYQMEFNIQNNSYASKDLNILNNLITETPFIEMCYQQNPYKIVWFLSANSSLDENNNLVGKSLIGLTYDKEQDVFAWHRHKSGLFNDDSFLSMASVPHKINNSITDEMYFLMKRRVPDLVGTKYIHTLEVMDNSLNVDFGVRIKDIGSVSSVTGPALDYLNNTNINSKVYVVADGALLPVDFVVLSTYTFPEGFTARDIQLGFNYTSSMLTVRPEVATRSGTSQGIIKRWNQIYIRIYNSLGLKINGQFIPNRTPQNLLDQAVPLFTGDVNVENLGYDRDARVLITQESPLPANILAMFGQLMIGEN